MTVKDARAPSAHIFSLLSQRDVGSFLEKLFLFALPVLDPPLDFRKVLSILSLNRSSSTFIAT